MKLTRAAAQRALEAPQDPTPRPNPTPQDPALPQPRPRDPNLPFNRAATIVLRAVTLSAQLAAGAFTRAQPATTTTTRTQSDAELREIDGVVNRCLLTSGLERLAEAHPNRQALMDNIEDAADESLAAHPADPLPAHFIRACRILGLSPTDTALPDHLAEFLTPDAPPHGPAPDD